MKKRPDAVLITAGTRRIGFQLAQTALAAGYSVILHYRSSCDAACAWLKKNPELKNRVFFIQHDLCTSPETIIKKARELPCTLTGLVNNASVFSQGNLFNHDHFQRMLTIHLNVPAILGSCFAAGTRKGWIINMTDTMIRKPNVSYQNYRMSKLFLEELTRQQAFLFAPGIRVNGIAPGAVLPAEGNDRKEFATLKNQIPLRRTGSVGALAEAFRFLITNDYCTGQIIAIDGGWHLKG